MPVGAAPVAHDYDPTAPAGTRHTRPYDPPLSPLPTISGMIELTHPR